jgi:endonuclease YncB( thermonuclease family)
MRIFAIYFIAALAINTPAIADNCLVVAVTDGDTLKARCGTAGAYEQITIRLAEIDAPERKQSFGDRSKDALGALCHETMATIKPQTKDRYGRTVARVECRGVDANAAMVKLGMAWAYVKYQTDPQFPQLEQQARAQRVGLWGDLDSAKPPTAPWLWRKLPKDER